MQNPSPEALRTESLTVALADRAYTIHIGFRTADRIRETVEALKAAGKRRAVITDTNVDRAHSIFINEAFGEGPKLVLPAGEQTKCIERFGEALEFLAACKLGRSDYVFAVGGGVIGDLAGYVAASYLRGVPFVQVPTSLLAMVDSSVGGKTGINLTAGKNLAGAFHQPRAVYADLALLDRLPAREFAAGMAEVIKAGLLADRGLFEALEAQAGLAADSPGLPGIIRHACKIKADVVAADEKEQAKDGGRALLNLGHTFGHAIEAVAGYGAYLHGEAIGIGLACAAKLSQLLGHLEEAEVSRIMQTVAAYGLPVSLREPLDRGALHAAMRGDKKNRDGAIRFVALESIGKAVTVDGVNRSMIDTCLEFAQS